MSLITLISCAHDISDENQSISFHVQYRGQHAIFFYNIDPDNHKKVHGFTNQNNRVYTEDELFSWINELHILNIRIHKILGKSYQDMGKLTFSTYIGKELIDQLVIPCGDSRKEVDYIF